jgi:serine/threonine-protein kinase
MQHCPECGRALTERQRSDGGQPDPAAGPADQSDLIGRTFFGEYTIVDRLGEGGMGAVYLAEQKNIDQKIALKVLHAETAESDEIVQRFHREAKVISRLSHPNIVRVFIFGRTDDDLLFLAMEYIEGVELREKLDGTPVDELMAIKIMKQVCSALGQAHDLSVIHRDLKPENILLTNFRGEDNYVKILDFGIAKIKHPDDQDGKQLTQQGIVYGTPEYLSPEQAQAEDLDHRTDIYALGCILFEMMTGQVPFDANASVEILKQKVFEDPPVPSDHAPVAPTMEEIIMKAMAKDREDRYSDALEMFDALVVREQELQNERQLDRRETYVPGTELTGVHQSDKLQNALDDEQGSAAPNSSKLQSTVDEMEESASSADDRAAVEAADTVAMDAPDADGGGAPGSAPNAASGGAARPSNPGSAQGGQAPERNSQNQQAARPNQPASPSNAQIDQPPSQPNQPNQPNQRADPPTDRQPPTEETSSSSGQTNLVRYALIAAVIVLAMAVMVLFVYFLSMVLG